MSISFHEAFFLLIPTERRSTVVSTYEGTKVQNFWLIRVRITPYICLAVSTFAHRSRKGASAAAARQCEHVLRPHGYQTDKRAPQKCRECHGHHVSEQGVNLHQRGKHGEAEQARGHGQRNLLDEL